MKNNFLKSGVILAFLSLATLIFSQTTNSSKWNSKFKKEVKKTEFMEGDIIFQTSNSMQSKAIQLATKSIFSHVGIILKYNGKLVVLEAVQPVKLTPIKVWISHGNNSYYSLKRLKNRDKIVTESSLAKMRKQGKEWLGKNYDIAFDWSDKKLYCSELVWKLYQHGCGIEVGELKKLKEYDLSHPIVKQVMEQRYGKNIPWEEKMISPQAVYESELLELIR